MLRLSSILKRNGAHLIKKKDFFFKTQIMKGVALSNERVSHYTQITVNVVNEW
jgi:hypothetical protein